ncbi:MAG: hypothetical protein ABIJ21_08160 [Nanoarchaeota archaeon]
MRPIQKLLRLEPVSIEFFLEQVDWGGKDIVNVEKVDLYEVPVETMVRFCGTHWASMYVVKKISDSEIVINQGGDYRRLAKGPLDAIGSRDQREYVRAVETGKREDIMIKGGVVEVGQTYILPYFHTPGEGMTPIDYINVRQEVYCQILVRFPEEKH